MNNRSFNFFILLTVILLQLGILSGLSVQQADTLTSLQGVFVTKCSASPSDGSSRCDKNHLVSSASTIVDIGEWLNRRTSCSIPPSGGGVEEREGRRTLLVFGTYAADFNAIEYAQRLRYYWPILQKEYRFDRCALLLNCQPKAAVKLKQLTCLPDDIELWIDNTGSAGRVFGVQRGWLPNNTSVSPFLKLFGMLWGLGAWATLPAVIGGYLGNPFAAQPWITDAMAVGIRQGRWPSNALELSSDGNNSTVVQSNKFDLLPLVGNWPRRPLELATLRLQNMLGISLQHWSDLAPDQQALDAGVLTQLGGCLVTDTDGSTLWEWRDPGICAVANFEDILRKTT